MDEIEELRREIEELKFLIAKLRLEYELCLKDEDVEVLLSSKTEELLKDEMFRESLKNVLTEVVSDVLVSIIDEVYVELYHNVEDIVKDDIRMLKIVVDRIDEMIRKRLEEGLRKVDFKRIIEDSLSDYLEKH